MSGMSYLLDLVGSSGDVRDVLFAWFGWFFQGMSGMLLMTMPAYTSCTSGYDNEARVLVWLERKEDFMKQDPRI